MFFRIYAFLFFLIAGELSFRTVVCGQTARQQVFPPGGHRYGIAPDLIVLKIGPSGTSSNGRLAFDKANVLRKISAALPGSEIKQAFPQRSVSNARRAGYDEFSNIYKIRLSAGTDIMRTINRLRRLTGIIYVEPYYENELLYIPDDAQIGSQNHLPVIHAYDAWDLEKGDSSVVIGIVDTGVDIDHPDLQNIAYNTADPVNGLDDDHDGYIDNYYGWDMSDEDNDPNADGIGHGSFVTGIAAARTDNALGVAGVGFRSKFLPVKVLKTSTNKLVNNYEGIVYAADHGCKVINIAWGGVYPWFQYGQDLINYAVLIKDAVVVGAAGNTNAELDFFPASFDHVLSVGATDFKDNKAAWATYSYHIDVMAPGDGVFTTNNAGSYRRGYGSSFSLPQVAGTAALIRSRYPELNARQVMERIRISADDIYAVGSNMDYYGMLGKGRLNVYRALTDTLSPSVRQTAMTEERSFEGYLFPGDTIQITGQYRNFLYPVKNLNISLTAEHDKVYVDAGDFFAGDMGTLGMADNGDRPYVLRLAKEIIPGERIPVRLDYRGDQYDDFQYFVLETTPEYFPVYAGKAELTVTSDGDLGYNANGLSEGEGVYFDGDYLGDWLGLILATDSLHVSDNIVNDYAALTRDEDFEDLTFARLYKNALADVDARSVFRESDSLARPIGIQVEQKILGWDDGADYGFFILEYRLVNRTDSMIRRLSAGIYADWNLSETGREDAAAWYSASGIAYVYDKQQQGLYTGLSLLTPGDTSVYAIDIGGDPGYPSEMDSLFTDPEKYAFLAPKEPKRAAGTWGKGNDVAQMFGVNNLTVRPGEGKKIAFVMLFGHSLAGLDSALSSAKEKYGEYLSHPPVEEYFHACYGDSALIDPSGGDLFEFYGDPFQQVQLDSGRSFKTPPVHEDMEYYVVNLDSGYRSDIRTVRVVMETPEADFSASRDTLIIGDGTDNEVIFTNRSRNGDIWLWTFGNGLESTLENPSSVYDETGGYEVKLVASNAYHCADSVTKYLMVGGAEPVPDIRDTLVCKGDTAVLRASNVSLIRIYADPLLSNLLAEGDSFATGPLWSDTVFYAVNAEGSYESLPAAVRVKVSAPKPGFSYGLDTVDLNEKYLLVVSSDDRDYHKIRWLLDGLPAGASDPVQIDYTGRTSFEITQILEDSLGCTDSTLVAVETVQGPAPAGDSLYQCRGEEAMIRPQGGNIFYFYGDSAMERLIHKGSVYFTGPLEESNCIFVTNMEGLAESPAAEFRLEVSAARAVCSFSTDTLDLVRSNTVIVKDESADAAWSYWELPSGLIDSSKVLYEQFDQTGIYTYRLFAGDAYNCVDSLSKELHVVYITGLTGEEENVSFPYPNPAQTYVQMRFSPTWSGPCVVKITSADGRLVSERKTAINKRGILTVDISGLAKGLYLLKVSAGDLVYSGRVLKR